MSEKFDMKKVETLYASCIEAFQLLNPNIGEILVALGNLEYALGASIEGYTDKGPSLEDLEKIYMANPGKIGISLMMQGANTTMWLDQLVAAQKEKEKPSRIILP